MKPVIRCFYGEIEKFPLNQQKLKAWIKLVISNYDVKWKHLGIVFCNDEELSELNVQYLNHDTLTDIITFPYHQEGEPVHAELYISVPRVKENAENMNVNWKEELDRVIIHGVLHLLGYPDNTPEQKQFMRDKEDYCLSLRT
jgi:probable rRNA maturation factor